ncbi:MAG: DUF4291 family protein [Myxococcota bacterium]
MIDVPLTSCARAVPDRRTVLATYDDDAVIVWQAHSDAVADAALRDGGFGGRSWRTDRTTRFRLSLPSLLARNGWATRPGRERILAVRLCRVGFDAVLRQAVHAAMEPGVYPCRNAWHLATRYGQVTLAWHPDVDPTGAELDHETLRVGVRDGVLARFARDWVVGVEDWTPWVVANRTQVSASLPVPAVAPYPLVTSERDRLAGRGRG